MAENNEKVNWKERDLGALWKKVKDGQVTSLSGKIKALADIKAGEEIQIVVFKNKFKDENPNGPDYRIYLAPPRTGEAPAKPAAKKPAPAAAGKPAPKKPAAADDSGDAGEEVF